MSIDEPQLTRRQVKDADKQAAPDASASNAPGDSSEDGKQSKHSKGAASNWFVKNSSSYAFTLVAVLSFVTRYWKIWDPAQVVFDEVHFGKFASYYLRREYHFDIHPPLAKMVIALGGWLVGYDGHFLFEKIGMDYMSNGVPYILLRGWVAMFGFALPPLVYMIMAESGYSVAASLLAGVLVTFDNALVTQGRLILLDNIMIFFMLAAVYSYVRFFKLRYRAFGTQWWTWLLSTGAMLGCAVSCKMVGLLTMMLIGSAVLYDLWRIIDIRRGTTMAQFTQHFMARAFALLAVPFALYISFFYVHLAVLTSSGPGDAYHTAKFQMQLLNNPMRQSSFDVHFGDEIQFRHRDTGVYMESSADRYPLRYADQRVSSQGQQVTGAKKRSDNAYWRIKPAQASDEFAQFMVRKQAGEAIPAEETDRWAVHNLDFVQLEHVNTGMNLRTHDVASPMTATNMEITTLALNDTAKEADTVWQIKIDHAKTNATRLQTSASFMRIVSQKHGVAVWTHSKALPDWGHKHQEINGNKKPEDKSTLWTVPRIRGRSASAEELDAMAKKIVKMGFLAKFAELQGLMFRHNNALTTVHPFQSTPLTWPFMVRGISFWTDKDSRRQIYLMGNPVGWWISDVALLMYGGTMVMIALLTRRNVEVVDGIVQRHMLRSTGFIVAAWVLHYAPFFLMGRSLFLHHYLPSSIFAYMTTAALFQFASIMDYPRFALKHWHSNVRALVPSGVSVVGFGILVAAQVACFLYFAPLTYGTTGLSVDEIHSRRWLSTYDLHFQT
ncbi:Dolichyl-phosphate-mannose--protein mannosyltransferase 4 [Coemansia sp. RSA 520]|nr:Dolichyl-phosphate-mannose--protein mannosyltransferase 4 [Coemansia sp. RSA 522]KAJ2222343.1 Dolichyl-phosphate-mannose--protein mannosyltransferase 4 [Coemansia sp. RSA 520]KAJ2282606.1 Dolichyl-phosphate-mannose--protein mannosyltransferase 4 [Coemansia sp. RSA 370]KAJ2289639.1 Dolichyl-phosphate-mannose--protein mannosyltransferase 4 [Coemansia sp. RSA 355]KAJ2592076.1 Dolichyl-phosphate-mannose--protein mannosyltransferase 4 [Coemansia sp. RSA 1797]